MNRVKMVAETRVIGEPPTIVITDSPTAQPGRPGVIVVGPGRTGTNIERQVRTYSRSKALATREAKIKTIARETRNLRLAKEIYFKRLEAQKSVERAKQAIKRGEYDSEAIKDLDQLVKEKVISSEQRAEIRRSMIAQRKVTHDQPSVLGYDIQFEPQFKEVKTAQYVETKEDWTALGLDPEKWKGPTGVVTTSFEAAGTKTVLGQQQVLGLSTGETARTDILTGMKETAEPPPSKPAAALFKMASEAQLRKEQLKVNVEGYSPARQVGAKVESVLGQITAGVAASGFSLAGQVVQEVTGGGKPIKPELAYLSYLPKDYKRPVARDWNKIISDSLKPADKPELVYRQYLPKDYPIPPADLQRVESTIVLGGELLFEYGLFKGAGKVFKATAGTATGQLISGAGRQARLSISSLADDFAQARKIKKIEAFQPKVSLADEAFSTGREFRLSMFETSPTKGGQALLTGEVRAPSLMPARGEITKEFQQQQIIKGVDVGEGLSAGETIGYLKQTTRQERLQAPTIVDVWTGDIAKVGAPFAQPQRIRAVKAAQLIDEGRFEGLISIEQASTPATRIIKAKKTPQKDLIKFFDEAPADKITEQSFIKTLLGTKKAQRAITTPKVSVRPKSYAKTKRIIEKNWEDVTAGISSASKTGSKASSRSLSAAALGLSSQTRISSKNAAAQQYKLSSKMEQADINLFGEMFKHKTAIKQKRKTLVRQDQVLEQLLDSRSRTRSFIPVVKPRPRPRRIIKEEEEFFKMRFPDFDGRKKKPRKRKVTKRTKLYYKDWQLPDLGKIERGVLKNGQIF